ncbi:MAG: endonuclease, partial [Muribaculaceae bacterium]|nr:endonuclease [Muribaculaceae bacterium]
VWMCSADAYCDGFNGLSGQQLRDAVIRVSSPESLLQSPYEIWQILRMTESAGNGRIKNAWSSVQPEDSQDIPDGFEIFELAPAGWWSVAGYGYDGPTADLYNFVVAPSDVSEKRSERLPGNLDDPTADYGEWQIGIGKLGAHDVAMYAPPEHLRGDIARAIMYLAMVYPSALHSNSGYMVFGDGNVPGLSARMYDILKEWNDADPPDSYEYFRNDKFGTIQGNTNPFVMHTKLGEYIWGNSAGKPYSEDFEPPVVEDVDISKYPLKGRYVRSTDRYLCFYSVYVPEDAVWYMDGVEVTGGSKWIDLEDLTSGLHEISFSSYATGKNGKVIIEIVP